VNKMEGAEPVTLETISKQLRQIQEVVSSLSSAVVELDKTVKRHLNSHDEDARRIPHSAGDLHV
jgi:hypothetical protein